MHIEGKVQISIEDFESLKAAAEAKEQAEKQAENMAKRIADIVRVKDGGFMKEMERIDSESLTDKQVRQRISEAYKFLKIAVDREGLKKLIRWSFRLQKSKSRSFTDIKSATDEELNRVQIELIEE